MKHLIVTGGAGFIGSAFVEIALKAGYRVSVVDSLTYAGNPENLAPFKSNPQFSMHAVDIRDFSTVSALVQELRSDGIVHFAAESHVDNSITGPRVFMETNIMGTFSLLESVREAQSKGKLAGDFRFLHVSTDEVFGELGPTGFFSETTPYAPNSPYSASKASSDLIVRAWHETYGVNTVTTNCSNNYGPRQFPEKLIPRMITCALEGKALPVYGKGENIRDWIHVEDHSRGVLLAFEKGKSGQTYCFGGRSERKNIDLVRELCRVLDQERPRAGGKKYEEQIEFVKDRLGHDFRYAIDDSKAEKELGFKRQYKTFEDGLKQTVQWYLKNETWLKNLKDLQQSRGKA